MINELWKPIEGYEEEYEISNMGRIRSLTPQYYGRIMKLEMDRSDYYVIRLVKFGVARKFAVHRLVYSNWKEDIPDGYVVHHIDENKLNNSAKNLMKLTVAEHRALHNKNLKPIYITI